MKQFLFSLLLLLLYFLPISAQNLGIGVNPPTQKLDVNGNVKFSGALMPNNLPGNLNDALISSGSGVAPIWSDATAGQSWSTVYSTDSLALSFSVLYPYYLLPGLTQTFTVPAIGSFDMFLYTDGGATYSDPNADNQAIQDEISIWIDGVAKRYYTVIVDNTANYGYGTRSWSFCYVLNSISPGSHTVEIKARVRSATGSYTGTVFCDPNTIGKTRIGSLNICLIRK